MIKRNAGLLLRDDACRRQSQGVLEAGVGIHYSGIGKADTCIHTWVEEQAVNPNSGKSRKRETEHLALELELRKNDTHGFYKKPLKTTDLIKITAYPYARH